MEKNAVAIALQLGSSCYRVGCLDNGTIVQLPNQVGDDETAAYYASIGTEILYGADAKNYATIDAKAVISEPMKAFYNETEPQEWPSHLNPRKVMQDTVQALLRDTVFNWRENAEIKAIAVSVSAAYLRHGEGEIKAIIYEALPELDAVLIVPKSTAAFLGYALSRDQCEDGVYLVLAIGSYLTELNMFHVENQAAVCQRNADTLRFGGQDFDEVLVEHCCQHFQTETGVDIRENQEVMYRLRAHCEMAKRKLSTALVTIVEIPQLLPGKMLRVRITRNELEEKMAERVQGFVTWLTKQIESYHVSISAVLVTGGASRIPLIQSSIKPLFPTQVKAACNAIAHCAAIMGTTTLTAAFSNRDLFENLIVKNIENYSVTGLQDAMAESAPLISRNKIPQEPTTSYAKDSPRMENDPTESTRRSIADHVSDERSSVAKMELGTTKRLEKDMADTDTTPDSKRTRSATNFEVPYFHGSVVITEYVRYSTGGIRGLWKKAVGFVFGSRESESYNERMSYNAKLETSFQSGDKKLTLHILSEGLDAITLRRESLGVETQPLHDTLVIQLKGNDPRTDRSLDDNCAVMFVFRFQSLEDCGLMKTLLKDCNH